MEFSTDSLNLLKYFKLTFEGKPFSLNECEKIKNYKETFLNELKKQGLIEIIKKDEFSVIWVTDKGIQFDENELLERKMEEQEKIKINAEIEELKLKVKELNESDKDYEKYRPEYEEYINLLHDYNEIKDAGQILMGRLAELEGTTTKSIYSEYQMNLED